MRKIDSHEKRQVSIDPTWVGGLLAPSRLHLPNTGSAGSRFIGTDEREGADS
jgi:hypothetical protein